MRLRRFPLLVGLLALLAARPAPAEPELVLDGQVGPAFLTRSRSRAIGHAFKPVARVGARALLWPRIELGGSASLIVDRSEHYRVLGALAHGRVALWQGESFSLGAGLGLGAGYDADILHEDLTAGGRIIPYGFVAADARWSIGRWLVGVEAGWENLSIARLGLLFGSRFHGPLSGR